jgi:hypothetical protein
LRTANRLGRETLHRRREPSSSNEMNSLTEPFPGEPGDSVFLWAQGRKPPARLRDPAQSWRTIRRGVRDIPKGCHGIPQSWRNGAQVRRTFRRKCQIPRKGCDGLRDCRRTRRNPCGIFRHPGVNLRETAPGPGLDRRWNDSESLRTGIPSCNYESPWL